MNKTASILRVARRIVVGERPADRCMKCYVWGFVEECSEAAGAHQVAMGAHREQGHFWQMDFEGFKQHTRVIQKS